jgi:signal transduction histidine kinase
VRGRLAPRSLTGRVTLAAVAAVGAALLVAGLAVIVVSGQTDRRSLDQDLERLAERPGPELRDPAFRPPPGFGDRDGDGRGDRGLPDPRDDRFTRVVLADGTVISRGATVPDGFPVPERLGRPETVSAAGEDWRTVVRPLPGGGLLQAAARLEPLQERQARLRLVVLAALIGALLATALVTRSFARLALRPIERLRETAGEVAETADLSVRVPAGDGPEEVDALAGDMNAMLERLAATAAGREAALASARRFAADAGHELRTPLTSLHANLATGATGAAERDADRLTALVEQLQQLARGEAGPPARTEDVDLGELADGAVIGTRTRHPGIDARLEAPASGPLLRGEAESLRMLLDNLLENAARHGRPDGTVVVTVASPDGRGAELLVDDDGPGIPPQERELVLERFTRGRDAQGAGTGLGLSIAAAQAVRHGGALSLEDSPLGGLRVRVRLAGVPTPADVADAHP